MTNDEETSGDCAVTIDTNTLSEIYLHYRGLVYFVVSTYVSNKEDADDVYQEVFLRLMNTRGRSFTKRTLKVYLCKTAKSCAIDFEKKRLNDVTDEVIEAYGQNDSQNGLIEEMGYELTNRESVLIDYRLSFGFAWKDICQITGIPMSSAKAIYRNAIRKIKRSKNND